MSAAINNPSLNTITEIMERMEKKIDNIDARLQSVERNEVGCRAVSELKQEQLQKDITAFFDKLRVNDQQHADITARLKAHDDVVTEYHAKRITERVEKIEKYLPYMAAMAFIIGICAAAILTALIKGDLKLTTQAAQWLMLMV